jgi:signal transduction histidine kinase
MKLRSPSLFWTFAGAFLGVALLGAFLQGVVVIDFLRTVARRTSGLDVVVNRASSEIAAALAVRPDADVTPILAAQQRSLSDAVVTFRDAEGGMHFASPEAAFGPPFDGHGPPPDRAAGPDRRSPPPDFAAGPDRRPPPPDFAAGPGQRPPSSDGGPPPFDRRGARFPPGMGPRPGGPQPLAVSQRVVVGDRVLGEVMAWQLGPPPVARVGTLTRFLLLLPLALVLASVAGLLLFRGVLGRLRVLQGLAGRVAAGDLDVRVPVPGGDEIGQLGAALNRMTEHLSVARRTVLRSDAERRQLFADISHELATPLTSIRGYAETLLEPTIATSAPERERYLGYIHAAAQRMDLLIQDLLELTRLEGGTAALQRERLDWAALCRNTLESFAARFETAGIGLHWRGDVVETWIDADGRRMEQVIDNLLVNALNYVPRGGQVWVSIDSAAAPARHRLIVADDGPGFRDTDLPHVFDRFYRGEPAQAVSGSGLGLAIVQEIVRRHGGSIRATNQSTGGASIEVELPAASAPI